MKDALIVSLHQVVDEIGEKIGRYTEIRSKVEEIVSLLQQDDASPVQEKPATMKKAKTAKKKAAREYGHDEVVKAAIELIKAEGAVTSNRITKHVKSLGGNPRPAVSAILAHELKAESPRLVKIGKTYDRKTTAKRVDVKRTPEEVDALLEEARKVRQVQSAA